MLCRLMKCISPTLGVLDKEWFDSQARDMLKGLIMPRIVAEGTLRFELPNIGK